MFVTTCSVFFPSPLKKQKKYFETALNKLNIVANPDPGSGASLTPGSGISDEENQDLGRNSRIIFLRAQ